MQKNNRVRSKNNSLVYKPFSIGFCGIFLYIMITGFSGMPVNNVIGVEKQYNVQTPNDNTHFSASLIKEEKLIDSASVFYNLGWEAYKKVNYDNARYYWEKGSLLATENPDKFNCFFRLGLLQQVGEGVNINLESAFNYYIKASNNGKPGGNVDATKNIGTFYENGMFVTKDNKKALEWYKKAKGQGNPYCDDDIARVNKNIYDLFEDIKKEDNKKP